MRSRLEKMLNSWSYKMDPSQYIKLYVSKVYQNNFAATGGNHMSSSLTMSTSLHKSLSQTNESTNISGSLISSGPDQAQQFLENDIVGLTVIEASPKYMLKFNTLRSHLNMQDHPLVKLLVTFRELLLAYNKDAQAAIDQLMTFYTRTNQNQERETILMEENEKLLVRMTQEIKLFVELMHDTVVRFYKLDVKTSENENQCECLSNLLTSLVLKSPVYSVVH